jgi:putative protein-disulfide isomerase
VAAGLTVLVVTDPLCSWCWGMASALEQVRVTLADAVDFDLVLGGINTDSTQPVGAYGRRLMAKLWAEVAQTTGQAFAELPETPYVHNSFPVCMVLERIRVAAGHAPFAALFELQEAFFTRGVNTTDPVYLLELLRRYGVGVRDTQQALTEVLNDPALITRLTFQFEMARSFGTQAMPSVLLRRGTQTRLLAGGYLDAPMLESVIREAL